MQFRSDWCDSLSSMTAQVTETDSHMVQPFVRQAGGDRQSQGTVNHPQGIEVAEAAKQPANTMPPRNDSRVSTGLGRWAREKRPAEMITARLAPNMLSRRTKKMHCRMNSCSTAQITYFQDRLQGNALPAPPNLRAVPIRRMVPHRIAPLSNMAPAPRRGRVKPNCEGVQSPVIASPTTHKAATMLIDRLSWPCGVQIAARISPKTRAISASDRPGRAERSQARLSRSVCFAGKGEKSSDFSTIKESI